jgi:hypothetical protein
VCRGSWGGRIFAGFLRTRNLLFVSIFSFPHFVQNVPIALNSNLTNPSKGPFSKINTLSLVLSLPFTVAWNAEPSESIAWPLVKTPGATEEMGTQNCGKYLCSHTCWDFVVSTTQTPSKRARTRRGVGSTLCGPEEMRVVARVERLGCVS